MRVDIHAKPDGLPRASEITEGHRRLAIAQGDTPATGNFLQGIGQHNATANKHATKQSYQQR